MASTWCARRTACADCSATCRRSSASICITAETLLRHFAVLKGIERRQVDEVVKGQQDQPVGRAQASPRHLLGRHEAALGIAHALIGDPRLIIVDEPTAGLDPGERLRFLNLLLSEIGENVVVILSTHIVEDVSDPCRRMAVISHGRVLLQGEPAAALESLHGKGGAAPSSARSSRCSSAIST